MDFLKKHVLPISLSVLGAAGAILYYRRNLSKETEKSIPSGIQVSTESSNLKTVEERLREIMTRVPQPANFKQELSETIYYYIFARTAEIEQHKVQSIDLCFKRSESIVSSIKDIIQVLGQSSEQLNQLSSEAAKLLQDLGLSTQQRQSISQSIQQLQAQHQQKIKVQYFDQARQYLTQKIAFIDSEKGKNLLRQIESYNWQSQDSESSAIINVLFDCLVSKGKAAPQQNYFCISVAISQSQEELIQQLNSWAVKLERVYRELNEAK